MKATPSLPGPIDAQLVDDEPTPLPPPPFDLDDDDHYFDDDDQPSWWSTLRPVSMVHAASPRSQEIEVFAPPAPLPVRLPPLPAPARLRTRAATDAVGATVHVLRVRARLAGDEQRAFDALMRGPAATDLITMLVNRGEDDALDNLRRRLDDEPSAAEAARRSLVAQIIAVSALLSGAEKSGALAGVAGLPPEELIVLDGRLTRLPPPEAATLIRTYLAARR